MSPEAAKYIVKGAFVPKRIVLFGQGLKQAFFPRGYSDVRASRRLTNPDLALSDAYKPSKAFFNDGVLRVNPKFRALAGIEFIPQYLLSPDTTVAEASPTAAQDSAALKRVLSAKIGSFTLDLIKAEDTKHSFSGSKKINLAITASTGLAFAVISTASILLNPAFLVVSPALFLLEIGLVAVPGVLLNLAASAIQANKAKNLAEVATKSLGDIIDTLNSAPLSIATKYQILREVLDTDGTYSKTVPGATDADLPKISRTRIAELIENEYGIALDEATSTTVSRILNPLDDLGRFPEELPLPFSIAFKYSTTEAAVTVKGFEIHSTQKGADKMNGFILPVVSLSGEKIPLILSASNGDKGDGVADGNRVISWAQLIGLEACPLGDNFSLELFVKGIFIRLGEGRALDAAQKEFIFAFRQLYAALEYSSAELKKEVPGIQGLQQFDIVPTATALSNYLYALLVPETSQATFGDWTKHLLQENEELFVRADELLKPNGHKTVTAASLAKIIEYFDQLNATFPPRDGLLFPPEFSLLRSRAIAMKARLFSHFDAHSFRYSAHMRAYELATLKAPAMPWTEMPEWRRATGASANHTSVSGGAAGFTGGFADEDDTQAEESHIDTTPTGTKKSLFNRDNLEIVRLWDAKDLSPADADGKIADNTRADAKVYIPSLIDASAITIPDFSKFIFPIRDMLLQYKDQLAELERMEASVEAAAQEPDLRRSLRHAILNLKIAIDTIENNNALDIAVANWLTDIGTEINYILSQSRGKENIGYLRVDVIEELGIPADEMTGHSLEEIILKMNIFSVLSSFAKIINEKTIGSASQLLKLYQLVMFGVVKFNRYKVTNVGGAEKVQGFNLPADTLPDFERAIQKVRVTTINPPVPISFNLSDPLNNLPVKYSYGCAQPTIGAQRASLIEEFNDRLSALQARKDVAEANRQRGAAAGADNLGRIVREMELILLALKQSHFAQASALANEMKTAAGVSIFSEAALFTLAGLAPIGEIFEVYSIADIQELLGMAPDRTSAPEVIRATLEDLPNKIHSGEILDALLKNIDQDANYWLLYSIVNNPNYAITLEGIYGLHRLKLAVAKEGIRRFLVTSLGAVRIETGAVESESALVESTSFGALAKGFSLPKMIDLLGSLANQKAPRLATPIDQYLIFAAFDTLLDESNSAWSPALDQTVKKVVGGNATPLTLRELIEAHLFEFSAIDLEQGDEDEELRDLARLVARGGGQNGLVLGQFGGRFEQLTLHLHPTFVALAKAVEERKVWLETEMKLLDSRLAFLRTKKRELQSNPPASLIEQQKNARAIALIDIELEFLVDTAQPSLNNFSVIAQARMELLPRQIWKLQHAEKTGKEALLADFKRYEAFTTKELLDQGAAGAALLAASEAYKDIITGTYWTWLRNKIVFASSPERTPKWNEFYEAVLKMEAGG